LYSDIADREVVEGAIEYRPDYALWSDGADKRRWLILPDGERVDSSDMAHWVFPLGTKFFKEFSRGGKLLETRLIERVRETGFLKNDYFMGTFIWRPDQSDAELTPGGRDNVLGTEHDVPRQKACIVCHQGEPGAVLGFSAVQLSASGTLAKLAKRRVLSDVPDRAFELPGDDLQKAAIGSMHANCGHCHAPNGMADFMHLRVLPEETGLAFEELDAYKTTVGVPLSDEWEDHPPEFTHRIVPGDPDASAIAYRMGERGDDEIIPDQMPPLATRKVDDEGLAAVRKWIESLTGAPMMDAGVEDAGERDAGADAGEADAGPAADGGEAGSIAGEAGAGGAGNAGSGAAGEGSGEAGRTGEPVGPGVNSPGETAGVEAMPPAAGSSGGAGESGSAGALGTAGEPADTAGAGASGGAGDLGGAGGEPVETGGAGASGAAGDLGGAGDTGGAGVAGSGETGGAGATGAAGASGEGASGTGAAGSGGAGSGAEGGGGAAANGGAGASGVGASGEGAGGAGASGEGAGGAGASGAGAAGSGAAGSGTEGGGGAAVNGSAGMSGGSAARGGEVTGGQPASGGAGGDSDGNTDEAAEHDAHMHEAPPPDRDVSTDEAAEHDAEVNPAPPPDRDVSVEEAAEHDAEMDEAPPADRDVSADEAAEHDAYDAEERANHG
jgi:hypothetical protein